MRFSKWVIVSIILLNITFTIAVLFNHYHTGSEPSTLVLSWFGFMSFEVVGLAAIKVVEVIKKGDLRCEDCPNKPQVYEDPICKESNGSDSYSPQR